MTTQDVIGEHPDDNNRVRAYLIPDRKIIEVSRWDNGGVFPLHYDRCQFIRYTRDKAILLHYTGIEGRRVCPECGGTGLRDLRPGSQESSWLCQRCGYDGDSKGYLPAMIYQGDVVVAKEPPGGIGIGIVGRSDSGVSWVVRMICLTQLSIESQAYKIGYQMERFALPDNMLTVLGSLFEFETLVKPEQISDEQWAWVEEQFKRLEV